MVAPHDDTPVPRPSARVLLIDDNRRTLLFASEDEMGQIFWYPPGGGSEPEEPAEVTARREVWEETGLRAVPLAAEIGRRRGLESRGGVIYDHRERWFLARVAPFQIDTTGFTDDERRTIAAHHWWTMDEYGDC
jgi:8-oxo-dGTP pyrophosphatase MutT (NUDIX family)